MRESKYIYQKVPAILSRMEENYSNNKLGIIPYELTGISENDVYSLEEILMSHQTVVFHRPSSSETLTAERSGARAPYRSEANAYTLLS